MIEVNSRAPTNEKVYTSKSAPLVNKIRERFFNEQWPKYSGIYKFSLNLVLNNFFP